MILPLANLTVAAVQANPRRNSIRIQNQGPGNIWLARWWFDSIQGAQKLAAQGTLLDVPPGPVHKGEWYVQTDTPNTVVSVDEQ